VSRYAKLLTLQQKKTPGGRMLRTQRKNTRDYKKKEPRSSDLQRQRKTTLSVRVTTRRRRRSELHQRKEK